MRTGPPSYQIRITLSRAAWERARVRVGKGEGKQSNNRFRNYT
jgi:hypothetical protein